VGQVLGTQPETTIELNLRIRNSSVTEFAFTPKRHMLVTYNTLPHLDDASVQGLGDLRLTHASGVRFAVHHQGPLAPGGVGGFARGEPVAELGGVARLRHIAGGLGACMGFVKALFGPDFCGLGVFCRAGGCCHVVGPIAHREPFE
jgi:hypothetical protein